MGRWVKDIGRREPGVSVVIPAYGRVSSLDRAVASVLAQTASDWELTILDDASPHPDIRTTSEAWARRDERITYIRAEANFGLLAIFRRAAQLGQAPRLLILC